VTLAAILGATRVPGVPALTQQRLLFFGAGQANLGAAHLILQALMDEGLSQADARSRLWLFDSQV
jgi:malic enzyme